MFTFVFAHSLSCFVVYAAVLFSIPTDGASQCGLRYLTPGVLAFYLIEIIILAIILVVKFRGISSMRDGLSMKFELKFHVITWSVCFVIWLAIWNFIGKKKKKNKGEKENKERNRVYICVFVFVFLCYKYQCTIKN